MDMDDFDNFGDSGDGEAQPSEPGAEEQEQRGRARGRGKGSSKRAGRGAAKAKAKNAAKARAVKACFAASCDRKAKAHSRFCQDHHRDAEAIRYQAKQTKDPAQRKERMEAVEHALSDPAKAKLALEDFARLNPPGRFRKGLVDWTVFVQRFGKRMEVRTRQGEELMDITDYLKWQCKDRGVSEEDAMDKWAKLLESDLDMEGDGTPGGTSIWIPQNKQRFKDVIRYKDQAVEEGSKAAKNMSDGDRPGWVCQR